jgi:hypothetical protein
VKAEFIGLQALVAGERVWSGPDFAAAADCLPCLGQHAEAGSRPRFAFHASKNRIATALFCAHIVLLPRWRGEVGAEELGASRGGALLLSSR